MDLNSHRGRFSPERTVPYGSSKSRKKQILPKNKTSGSYMVLLFHGFLQKFTQLIHRVFFSIFYVLHNTGLDMRTQEFFVK